MTTTGEARLWPQTERLKAGLILARRGDLNERRYLFETVEAARSLRCFLNVPAAGLWRDTMKADGAFIEEPAPASSFYHIAVALGELRTAREYLLEP